MSQNTKR